jgi:hypothetical protein
MDLAEVYLDERIDEVIRRKVLGVVGVVTELWEFISTGRRLSKAFSKTGRFLWFLRLGC